MEKIIIENRSKKLSIIGAMERVDYVLRQGKISKTSKGEQYCFITTWKDNIAVSADKNKKSDRFVIWDIPNNDKR